MNFIPPFDGLMCCVHMQRMPLGHIKLLQPKYGGIMSALKFADDGVKTA